MQGKVTKIECAHGPFGNQFIPIDGTRYATWFAAARTPVRRGATVEYAVQTINGVEYTFTEEVIRRVH